MKVEKLDPISHIHHRPDMYVGSIKSIQESDWVCSTDFSTISFRPDIPYNPGLVRIFVEVLSNVIDNVWRSREAGLEPDKITITIDEHSIAVMNDGLGISFDLFGDTDIPIPELIFGHLLTSTNYNDTEMRMTSGRNGLGVKLTNVFSTRFEIELWDVSTKRLYRQKWEDNMRKCGKPSIKSCASRKSKNSTVSVKFVPDFQRFGMERFTPDILSLFYRYCVDMAMITRLSVVVNGHRLRIRSMMDYVKMMNLPRPKECVVVEKSEGREIVLCASDDGYREVVFTNGVYNRLGGVHSDVIMQDIGRSLLTKIQSRLKSTQIGLREIKQHFLLIVNMQVPNPEFSNQSKDRLLSPSIRFNVDAKIVSTVMKWSFMDRIRESVAVKEVKDLKRMEKRKVRVEGYDPANLAGTRRAGECTLILCEGLSAKTYAVSGINVGWNGVKGRDYFGVYPMRGKTLNVRNASMQTIMNNKELMDISNILGLKYGSTSLDSLNYGRVMILCDSDVDGIHIASLLLNYVDVMYPHLFQHPFVYMMLTPIAKIKDRTFYSEQEYYEYLETQANARNLKVRYYKGLGTSSAEDVKETFGKRVIRFVYDDRAKTTLNKVFHQKHAQERKQWMESYDPKSYVAMTGDECGITQFIDHELIRFSIDDCRRNLPNLFDGLKLSQRKILYSVLKKNLVYGQPSMKVAQLAGYVAEVSNYHHGEQCLLDTIIRMTHSFVGSNNLPLLYPDGQFGSRLSLGKDAANGRYIFTKMQPYTSVLFSKEDEPLLRRVYDDNELVEPEYYMPILPMILVNGCTTGIGTGWSCSMPNYDVGEVVERVMGWIDARMSGRVFEMEEMTPSWRGFRGEVTRESASRYVSHGVFVEDAKGRVVVSEIPVQTSIDRYKEFLEGLVDERKIRHLKNYSTTDRVHFEFVVQPPFRATEESLRLSGVIHLTNMVLFGKNHQLQKFATIADIFETFCEERYRLYELRKAHRLEVLRREKEMLENKTRFLDMVLSKKWRMEDVRDEDMDAQLTSHGFVRVDGDYAYLLNMPIRSISKSRRQQLTQQLETTKTHIKTLHKTHIGDLWKHDLHHLQQMVK